MSRLLLVALCLLCVSRASAEGSFTLASGLYDFEFVHDRVRQVELACIVTVGADGTLALTAGKRDPLPGRIDGQAVTFAIRNDANEMTLAGTLQGDGYVVGTLRYATGGQQIDGSFRLYPTGRDPQRR